MQKKMRKLKKTRKKTQKCKRRKRAKKREKISIKKIRPLGQAVGAHETVGPEMARPVVALGVSRADRLQAFPSFGQGRDLKYPVGAEFGRDTKNNQTDGKHDMEDLILSIFE